MSFTIQDMFDRRRKLAAELAALDSEIEAEALRLAKESGKENARTDDKVVDFSLFKDTTRRLLVELWDAPDRMLSQEHIKEYVILDEYASDSAVKMVIRRARQEIENCSRFLYEIVSIPRKGYQLASQKGNKK